MRRLARRSVLGLLAVSAAAAAGRGGRKVFDVHDFGATGDGVMPDTLAIQRAIDAAATAGGGVRVLLRGGHRYLIGPLTLRGGIDFHLADDAELLVSTRPEDYAGTGAGELHAEGVGNSGAVLHASGADGLTISGTGSINGRSPEFMERYDAANEWWVPKPFRPRLLVLENCARLAIRDITFRRAPSWTVHLLGCRNVMIERVTILNQLDVPNCDGIDPDHCQQVEIRNCRIVCGDDAIVVKTTAGHERYGPSHHIVVRDCVLETQDSGLKIGTETVQDVHDILFERCRIISSCRGLCIQLRDGGNVRDIVFRDIEFVSRYHSAPWWGRGEAISFTAIPRTPMTRVGTIAGVRVENVRGRAENSIRIEGLAGARVSDIILDRVEVSFGRTTAYPGGVYDNRPTTAFNPIEPHGTAGISIRHADRVTLKDCTIRWADRIADDFTNAVLAEDVTGLATPGFAGAAAHPKRDEAIRTT